MDRSPHRVHAPSTVLPRSFHALNTALGQISPRAAVSATKSDGCGQVPPPVYVECIQLVENPLHIYGTPSRLLVEVAIRYVYRVCIQIILCRAQSLTSGCGRKTRYLRGNDGGGSEHTPEKSVDFAGRFRKSQRKAVYCVLQGFLTGTGIPLILSRVPENLYLPCKMHVF